MRMLGSTIVMVLLVGGLALAVQFGWIAGAAISLKMTLGPIEQSGSKLTLPLRLTLNNPSGRTQSLKPQNVCKIFRWFVLDETSAFVQSSTQGDCDNILIERALRPWEEIDEDFKIKLEAKRFKPGQSYYLITRFWGLEQQQKFNY